METGDNTEVRRGAVQELRYQVEKLNACLRVCHRKDIDIVLIGKGERESEGFRINAVRPSMEEKTPVEFKVEYASFVERL
jgi:hypothetical protein